MGSGRVNAEKKKTKRAGGRWADTKKSVRNRQATGRVEGVERSKKRKRLVSVYLGRSVMYVVP